MKWMVLIYLTAPHPSNATHITFLKHRVPLMNNISRNI